MGVVSDSPLAQRRPAGIHTYMYIRPSFLPGVGGHIFIFFIFSWKQSIHGDTGGDRTGPHSGPEDIVFFNVKSRSHPTTSCSASARSRTTLARDPCHGACATPCTRLAMPWGCLLPIIHAFAHSFTRTFTRAGWRHPHTLRRGVPPREPLPCPAWETNALRTGAGSEEL